MYLCYVDESGNTGKNLQDVHQPTLVLTSLLVPPENVKEIEEDIRTLSYSHFGRESRNTDFEFHGDHIYNARGRYFKKLSLEQRFKILDELVDITIKHEAIKIGYVSITKAKYFAREHIQQAAFSFLVEKIEEKLKGTLNSHGLIIADEQDELEQKLIDDLDHFKQYGTHFGYKNVMVDKIIDSVHFVQSNNNYLMQLTDVLCYLIRKGKEASKKLSEQNGADANKGIVYFNATYNRIISKKPWLFTKIFP